MGQMTETSQRRKNRCEQFAWANS